MFIMLTPNHVMDYYLYVKSFGAVFVKLAANNTGENFLLFGHMLVSFIEYFA